MRTLHLKLDNPPRDSRQRAWALTAWVSGAFVLLFGALMLFVHGRAPAHDPLTATALVEAKQNLRANPEDETLQNQVRALDVQIREGFFLRLARNDYGSWLLLGGVLLFAVSARNAAMLHPQPPTPGADANVEHAARERNRTIVTVGIVGLVALFAVGLVALGGKAPNLSLGSAARPDAAGRLAVAGPDEAGYLANWPRFRGPRGDGVAASTNIPVSFDIETGENVSWKVEIPLNGFSSPVVWSNRIFFTGCDERARELFCFDAENGALLWRLRATLVSEDAAEAMGIPSMTGLAAPTAATDGERIYALFSTGELIAADFSGRLVWSKNLGQPDNMYGFATSLITWRNRVILQFDQAEPDANKSRLIALDGRTGKLIWQKPRPVAATWTTPLIGKAGAREQLVTVGEPWVIAYEPESGGELWRCGGFGTDLVPSPIIAQGLVVATDAARQVLAITPDGRGDVTQSGTVWTNLDFVPDIAGVSARDGLLFTVSMGGTLACLDVKTGAGLWEQRFKGDIQSSPTIVGDRLYLITTDGEMVVVRVAREFAELARGTFGEEVYASPAVVRDRLFVRGEKHLFCLGTRGGSEAGDEH